MLNAIRMVPASRSMTRQRYDLGKTSFEDIPVIEGQGQQEEDTATTLAYSRSDVEKISIYMAQVTGVGIRTDVIPPQSVKTFSVTAAGDVSLPAEGSGTNSLVRLLFELVRAQPGATVLIEEPEISLHPQAQAQLASVIADEAKTQNKQVIMTTHSELIPGRLLIEIAEGNLTPDDLAIYAFHKDENGVGSATEITINERGQTTGGLPGFFDTHMQEMDRHARALMPEH